MDVQRWVLIINSSSNTILCSSILQPQVIMPTYIVLFIILCIGMFIYKIIQLLLFFVVFSGCLRIF